MFSQLAGDGAAYPCLWVLMTYRYHPSFVAVMVMTTTLTHLSCKSFRGKRRKDPMGTDDPSQYQRALAKRIQLREENAELAALMEQL